MPRFKILNGEEVQLTSEEEKIVDAEEIKVQLKAKEYLKVKYRDDRKRIYPEIGDQLDDLFKQGAFSEEMTAKLQQVKTDNPKPE